jgi:NitT/TauT family transport system substrate-binding protein
MSSKRILAVLLGGALGIAGMSSCGSSSDSTTADTATADTTASAEACTTLTPVKITLQWVTQAQFAGNFAAQDQGFYEDACIDLQIQPGGPDINPVQLLLTGDTDLVGVQFGAVLTARDEGADVITIGQVFERSAFSLLSFTDKGINAPEDVKGKKVALWGGFVPSFSAMAGKHGLVQDKDFTTVNQGFDVLPLLNDEVDMISAMRYNEYAQALAGAKGREITLFDFGADGTSVMEDTIATTREWVTANPDVVKNYLKATMKGWMYCRDNPDACVQIVLKNGSALQENFQTWQMNEVNKLMWPSTNGLFALTQGMFDQSAGILFESGVIKTKAVYSDVVDTSVRDAAAAELASEDLNGSSFAPQTLDPAVLFAGG